MNFCTFGSIFSLIMASCMPPADEQSLMPDFLNERVMPVAGWDMGCDNLGQCVAIGAVPPRKTQMDGIRGALRIAFSNEAMHDPELTIIPLDFEQRLPDVKPSPDGAKVLLQQLRDGNKYMLWYEDTDGSRYYLPARDFGLLTRMHQRWLSAFPVRLVQQEPIAPTLGVERHNFRAPELTDAQMAGCDAPDRGTIEIVWDIGGHFNLLRYACEAKDNLRTEKLWFMQDTQRGTFTPIQLDQGPGRAPERPITGRYGGYFEPTLGLFVMGRSAASDDCGLVAVHAATASGFVLAERREAVHCAGLFGGDWVRSYANPAVMLPEHW
jgi:hypothetical protein